MAMTPGTVTIAANGTASGSGMARAIYDQMMLMYALTVPKITLTNNKQGLDAKRGQALFANALAAALVPYITTNAKARVAGGQGGLQKTPNPNTADTHTVGPVTPALIEII